MQDFLQFRTNSDLKHVRRQRDGDGKLNNVELNKLRKKWSPVSIV